VNGKDRPDLQVVDGREDAVVRRRRFKQAHPEAVILPPCAGRWRAVAAGRTLGAWDLGGLMDRLDAIYPDGGTGTAVPVRRPGEPLR
jgi:hypothetical protein